MSARLEVEAITCEYPGQVAVRDLGFDVEPGSLVCLLGPSGCGKTTVLRAIAGFHPLSTGEIRIDHKVVSASGFSLAPEQRRVGMVFQEHALFPHMTAGQNVAAGLRRLPAAERGRLVEEFLDKVGLAGFGSRYPHELSGGQQQRIALARALAPRPALLLMDEPFSSLDDRLRDGIRDETLEILREQDTAVLLVTHEPEEAMRMADKIALMRRGRIVQEGAPYNIYNSPADRDSVAFFSDINVIRGKVEGSLVQTPFGRFLSPGAFEGQEVEIVIRPQHVKLDFDRGGRGPDSTIEYGTAARGTVKRARLMGSESLVEFRMDHDGSLFKVTVPNVFLPAVEKPMWLMIPRDRCFIFPANGGKAI